MFLHKTLLDQRGNIICQCPPWRGRKTPGDCVKRDIRVIGDDCEDFLPAGEERADNLGVQLWRDEGRILQHLAILCSIQQYCATLCNDIEFYKQSG